MMRSTIILLGPYLSGKSTLRYLLAEALQCPHCSLTPWEDELCLRYYREAGYDEAQEMQILDTHGDIARYRYMKPFEAYAIERCLAEHPGHVIEIFAEQSVQEDAPLLRRVQQALAPYPHVILLLPAPDQEESYRVLRERYWALLDIDFNEHFVKHHSNYDLATFTVYTAGKTPEATRDEILQVLQANDSMRAPILLIGPPAAGKTTIGRLLATRLGLPQVSLDGINPAEYALSDYDEARAQQIRAQEGLRGLYRYAQPFWAALLERVLATHQDAIIDFGAGHSVYEDDALFARAQRAIAPYQNVILLLPSPDLDESVRMLKERPRSTINGVDANHYLINHPSNYVLAKQIVYTHGKTPEATRDEIVECLKRLEDTVAPNPKAQGRAMTME